MVVVQEGGGYHKFKSEEMWEAVADALIFQPGSEGAGNALRVVYERLLLPLDRSDDGNDDYLADAVMVKAETKAVVERVPDRRFPKGSHKKFTVAFAALSASCGKVIGESIDICGKSVHLFDA